MTEEKFGEALLRLVDQVASLERKLDAVPASNGGDLEVFTYEEVAKLLKCSIPTVKRNVQSGKWGHCLVGGMPRIPKSEIVRITATVFRGNRSPAPLLPRQAPRRLRSAPNGKSEAAKIRAAAKSR